MSYIRDYIGRVQKKCEFRVNLKRALSMFIAEEQCQYAGLGFAVRKSLRAEVCAQMDKFRLVEFLEIPMPLHALRGFVVLERPRVRCQEKCALSGKHGAFFLCKCLKIYTIFHFSYTLVVNSSQCCHIQLQNNITLA
jgi:hypothetical protein